MEAPPTPPMTNLGLGGPFSRRQWIAMAAALGVLVAAAWLLPSLATMLAGSFLIAYLLDPAIDALERRGVNRTVAVVAFVVLLFALFALFALLVLPIASRQVVGLIKGIPDFLEWLDTRGIPWIEATAGITVPRSLTELSTSLRGTPFATDFNLVGRVIGTLGDAFSGTLGAVLAVVNWALIPVFSVYFLRSFDDIVAAIDGLVPPDHRASVRERAREVDAVLGDFVRGQLLVTTVMAVLYALGLWIAGIDLWLLIGLIAGFGNLVPYFGTAVGLALGVGAALFQFGDLLHVAAVAGVFAAVQFIEGFVLTPRIIGEKVGLHPMVVMVAILAGGELFGFVGILLAVPATAVGGVFFRHSLRTYKASALFNPKASDEASGDDAPPGPPGAPGS